MSEDRISFHLPDMSCGHCVAAITAAVQEADPAAQLSFEREARRVSVQSTLAPQALADLLTEAGYPPSSTDR